MLQHRYGLLADFFLLTLVAHPLAKGAIEKGNYLNVGHIEGIDEQSDELIGTIPLAATSPIYKW